MIMRRLFLTVSLCVWVAMLFPQQVNLIPMPAKVDAVGEGFLINRNTVIGVNEKGQEALALFLNEWLQQHHDLQLRTEVTKRVKSGRISFQLDKSMKEEAYRLESAPGSVRISGGEAGLFYGLQTLLQLIPMEEGALLQLPGVVIEDDPRFGYRGAMLDVGRYFFRPDEVKRFIDLMAHYKLNVFHWHLTEDAGWRVEIKKYPLLTERGAWRRGTQSSRSHDSFDRLPHGGYYTQSQIRDIVSYAQQRHITIIPEIDMPGHMLAALTAYPELSCTGGAFKVLEHWGIQEDVMCAGNEDTYHFIEGVMDELLDLFPSEIIHIGGDEAPKQRWENCPKCQERIRTEGLSDEHALQSYFVKRVGAYLQRKGRRMIGWDEIMEGGLAENAMVMSWRGEKGGIEAAGMGHEVVMAPNNFMYLDYYQGHPDQEPFNIGGNLPLERVYNYEPLSDKIAPSNRHFVVGVQGNLWMEFIHTFNKLEYMAFPRLLAVAETGWSKRERKEYGDFSTRLAHDLNRLDKKGVNFRIPNVTISHERRDEEGNQLLQLHSPVEGGTIYYTLDGRDPLQYGTLYSGPLKISVADRDSLQLQYVVRTKRGRVSGTRYIPIGNEE